MDINLIANTIRGLSMDGVQKANSGHPGMPMGVADIGAVLFVKFLKHSPANPRWVDRDRYVQSAGHGSMLLYSLLHLSGYDLSTDELKNFRQWGSKTPGHPEHGLTPGVETTTGPLGQGCGNAVGMALAETMLAAKFNREGFPIVDHHTFVIAGDGDMMEGISHEAFSLAGHLRLHKLIVLYDSNRITIEGSTDLTYSDDVRKRMESYHWNVLEIDGHGHAQIEQALDQYQTVLRKPAYTLWVVDYSGSMSGKGKSGAVAGLQAALDTDQARASHIEPGDDDVNVFIPFNSSAKVAQVAQGKQTATLLAASENQVANGNADIYNALEVALKNLPSDRDDYTVAIALLTDGQSDTAKLDEFKQQYASDGKGVPIFSIMFGDADSQQLNDLAKLSNGKVFDGRNGNLSGIFREVKGYN